MKKTVVGGLLSLALVAVLLAPQAHAETTPANSTDQLKALMAKLAELQAQLAAIQGQVQGILKANIAEGTTSDDVKKVQELLASDPTIYPEGKVTGYFGGLTKEAIKRFQKRHGLTETGIVDEETKALMEEYLKERATNPEQGGLLRTPEVMKKVEGRLAGKCDSSGPGKGMGPLCKRLKMEHRDGDMMKDGMMKDDMMDDEDDSDEDGNDESDDEDESDDKDSKVMTYRDTVKAFQDAEKSIAKAQREVNRTENETDEAKALIKEARMKLGEARTAKVAGKYADAVDLAEEAESIAEDARDAAKDADEEDESDDDEDDSDEDEDDESDDDDEDAEDDSEDDD